MDTDEERIALFLDYENLAIGAREALGGMTFDLRPVMDALAERGRVIARKAYADWSAFDEDRRMLTRWQVELIEIPQRMGASRKNAADIKMAVDALEVAFERDYVTTFVICTGDSDLTPLVHKLRELDKRVIGSGSSSRPRRCCRPRATSSCSTRRSRASTCPRTAAEVGSPPRGRPQAAAPEPEPGRDRRAGAGREPRRAGGARGADRRGAATVLGRHGPRPPR